MKKISVKILLLYIFFSLLSAVILLNCVVFTLCFKASSPYKQPELQLMRIYIYGSSSSVEQDTVSANISILDGQGDDCAQIERSWNGNYLSVDFYSSEFSGKKFYFPAKIYGTRTVRNRYSIVRNEKGTNLFKYYIENGQCFLAGKFSSFSQRKDLFILALFSRSPIAVIASGFSKKYSVNLSQCVPGKYYGIFINEKGLLELKSL